MTRVQGGGGPSPQACPTARSAVRACAWGRSSHCCPLSGLCQAPPHGAARPWLSARVQHPTAGPGHPCPLHQHSLQLGQFLAPVPTGTLPGTGQLEGPRQQHGEAQDRPRPATTRAGVESPQDSQSCSTPNPPAAKCSLCPPDGAPQVHQDRVLRRPGSM